MAEVTERWGDRNLCQQRIYETVRKVCESTKNGHKFVIRSEAEGRSKQTNEGTNW